MAYKVLIVDDEPAARQEVEALLQKYSDFRVVDRADNVDTALVAFSLHQPDVLFLDINLPGKNAFELIRHIRGGGARPIIVFVTGYDQYAIRAIKESALDYLLKPIDPAEFGACVEKIRSTSQAAVTTDALSGLIHKMQRPEKVAFRNRAGVVFLDPGEIVYCKADGNYSEVILGKGRTELVTMKLGDIDRILSQDFFIRLGRSIVLNTRHLEKILRGQCKIILQKDREEFEVRLSKRMVKQLEEAVGV